MRRTAILTTLVTAVFASAHAETPNFEWLDVTGAGNGTVEIIGKRIMPVTTVRVELKKGGDAAITFSGQETWKFTGEWWVKSPSNVAVKIKNALGSTVGSGTASIGLGQDNLLDQVSVSGQSGTTGYRAALKCKGSWPTGSPAAYGRLDQTVSGTGTLKLGAWTAELSQVSVQLTTNGDFTLRTYGKISRTLVGRWSAAKPNEIDLVVKGSTPRSTISAKGKMYLRDPVVVDRINIPGRADGRPFLLEFKAK